MGANTLRHRGAAVTAALLVLVAVTATATAQGLGGAGTIQGVINDPTGGVMQAVQVRITNPVSGFSRTVSTDEGGRYSFGNLPPNRYHLTVEAQGFQTLERDVEVRTGVPIVLDLTLELAGATTAVEVVGHAGDLLEHDPTAHTDIDQSLIARLPLETSSSGLNHIVTRAAPGVVSDSNGFFHPVGDHAQTQFSIDNQPITDQQSRVYSNQISPDAVQSMEVITGVPPAEYGDKSSLVVHIVTRSGLDQPRPSGTASVGYGSFQAPTAAFNLGAGSSRFGNFVSMSGLRTDRFLDPPELEAIHDSGNQLSFFDRLDWRPSAADTVHLNVQAGRSGFDVPNTYDQLAQTQHQDIGTVNIAPGYARVLGSNTLFTANGFIRRDHVKYLPSTDPLNDTPASVSQDRTLTNVGIKSDVSATFGAHNLKFGGTLAATGLHEQFTFAITDPSDAAFADAEGHFNEALAPFDLTSGGSPLAYDQSFTIKQQAAYVQDAITAGGATFNLGLRLDHYGGLVTDTQLQPRLGMSYAVAKSGTVLRASYGRTMETPYNENLLLSAGYKLNGLFGESRPVPPGRRNQVELGVQQGFGGWLVADVGYFNKRTDNGYDFGVLFNTPLAFPVAWDHSRINGFTGRLNLVEHRGFSAFVVMAHTNAIYSPPGVGGILLETPEGDFRIDHDQRFNATTNLQYVFEKRTGAWAALSWRHDSGLVAGAVSTLDDALALTAAQQTAIGFFCGGQFATRDQALTSDTCTPSNYGATRLRIPAAGTADDVANPARLAPRHLLDLGIGADNLLRTDRTRLKIRFSVINMTNVDALYNFLSTFSGTHFVTPRAYEVVVGWAF
jgi:hypothetical protein